MNTDRCNGRKEAGTKERRKGKRGSVTETKGGREAGRREERKGGRERERHKVDPYSENSGSLMTS